MTLLKLWYSTVSAFLLVAAPSISTAAEQSLSGDEIVRVLSGATLYGGENAEIEQIFQVQGLTIYIERGSVSQGAWSVKDNRYCSIWPPTTAESCYEVLRDGGQVIFVSRTGTRYVMRPTK
jgi:hypothetical protein